MAPLTHLHLTNVPQTLLEEWTRYAESSGLPLEYLIMEAVTYSVRSDRLGVEAAKVVRAQRKKQLSSARKHVNLESPNVLVSTPVETQPPTTQGTETSNIETEIVRNLTSEFMNSSHSSAQDDDLIPRNL